MQATPGTPYRVYYISKNFTPGLTDITAKIRYPNGVVVGPLTLTEVTSDMYYSGAYYLDVETDANDPAGEYLVMIYSANEGHLRTFEKIEYRTSSANAAAVATAVWLSATRGLTVPVHVNPAELASLATHSDIDELRDFVVDALTVWETKGSISMDPLTNSLDLIAWLVKDGEVVLDADSASIELRDSSDILLTPALQDSTVSVSGLFKFTQSGASAIIIKNRTYVLKIRITRGAKTYQGNVSISTY